MEAQLRSLEGQAAAVDWPNVLRDDVGDDGKITWVGLIEAIQKQVDYQKRGMF